MDGFAANALASPPKSLFWGNKNPGSSPMPSLNPYEEQYEDGDYEDDEEVRARVVEIAVVGVRLGP